jgi:uncharacterized protein YneF (UPF0154 family)
MPELGTKWAYGTFIARKYEELSLMDKPEISGTINFWFFVDI